MSDLLKVVEVQANQNVPELRSGDTVSVFLRIKEGNTERRIVAMSFCEPRS